MRIAIPQDEAFVPLADEAKLIQRATQYDQAAIGELYRANVQPIFRFIYLRVNDAHVAEDLTSDVFMRALEGLATYEYRGVPFSSWLYRIARDRVVDHYRRCNRRPVLEEISDGIEDNCPSPTETVIQAQQESEIGFALAQLTEDQRLVVELRFIERLALSEVAQQLGKTEGAVKSLQHRALAALSRILEARGCEPGQE